MRILVLILLITTGCSTPMPRAQYTLTHPADLEDTKIGTYVSDPNGFETSSYWIEGPQGLILIDTQFLLSAAEEFVNYAERITGKKAVLAIVLHPNPDKFNGTNLYKKRGIKVVTSEQVKGFIPEVYKLRTTWFYERFKPDYPTELPLPDSFGNTTQDIQAAGITIKVHVLGKGCSEAHVVVEYRGHLFPGDLVTNDFHSWLELGYLNEWIQRIEELMELDINFVHPGRGPAGAYGLLSQQEHYLETVRDIVKKEKPAKTLEATFENLMDKIQDAYPGYKYSLFVKNGLSAVWKNNSLKK